MLRISSHPKFLANQRAASNRRILLDEMKVFDDVTIAPDSNVIQLLPRMHEKARANRLALLNKIMQMK